MKKIFTILIMFLLFFTTSFTKINADIFLNISSESSRLLDGVTHKEIIGEVTRGAFTSNQVINYMAGNPLNNNNLHVIVGDEYNDLYYSRGTIETMANSINDKYSNYTVIGGVNADFFGNSGIPVEAYIRNGEIVSPGLGYDREVVGFKRNGEVVMGRPCFEGFELIIYSDTGKERISLDIASINDLPTTLMDITVIFDDYEFEVPDGLSKVIIDASDIKRDDYSTRYFGKGFVNSVITSPKTVGWGEFAIVTENPYVIDLIQDTDSVLVQQKVSCGFEDVEWAVGGYGILVENGVAFGSMDEGVGVNDRHPRTAIGVKADGTVFFVTVDGRQSENGMDGMNLYELADLMEYFGAETAYNLDGGGSTGMIMKSGNNYDYLNTPSDGQPRVVSNAIFFVTGINAPRPTKLSIPDLSIALDKPSDIYVDNNLILHWEEVLENMGYHITIDGNIYESNINELNVEELSEGTHKILIKALGDGFFYSDSRFTKEYTYTVRDSDTQSIINYFEEYLLDQIRK